MRATVFRKANFNCAHRLHNSAWSDEKNQAIFGKCNNPYYHGHNYDLHVQITGDIDPETGYVIDLKILNNVIQKEIVDKFDHKNLNLDTDEFKNLNPTAENIAVVIWNILRTHLDKKFVIKVRLYETERNYVEFPASE